MNGEIFVWESKHGWKVVEAWRDEHGCPYGKYIILVDSLRWKEAVDFAKRYRKTFALV
ncbi:MAG: hypothetical protein ACXAC5_03455 [Promethearchaeota archaeon]|jgi:hypothetical protein